MPTDPTNNDILKRLDEISLHLQHLDSRDRMRMVGGTIRSAIHVGFLLFAIWSSWYLLTNMGEIIQTMAQETAKATIQYGSSGSEDLMKQMQDLLKR